MADQIQSHATTDSLENPSEAIVDLIADLEGVDPVELSPPLHSVLDPEALDALFDSPTDGPTTGQVLFRYRGYEIRVRDDGEVAIRNR